MPSFLKDISDFYGTGEKNAAGQTLEEFLESYDPHRYETPSCTTDAAVFSYRGILDRELSGLKLLLVKRGNHPSIGFWALPDFRSSSLPATAITTEIRGPESSRQRIWRWSARRAYQ